MYRARQDREIGCMTPRFQARPDPTRNFRELVIRALVEYSYCIFPIGAKAPWAPPRHWLGGFFVPSRRPTTHANRLSHRWLYRRRHQTFVSALKVRGAGVHLATFKKTASGRHEEKETDVAVAVTLLELFHQDEADCAFVMSGDTELMPALRAARRMFPDRQVCFAFRHERTSDPSTCMCSRAAQPVSSGYNPYRWLGTTDSRRTS